uniref:RRM domain-containing protein n=1 Tax=Ananas comosus var. bracteatus TaxID=296719 RepID=A0A6V7QZ12_ANACO
MSRASSPAPAESSSGSRSVASCPGSPSPTSLSPATRASTAAAAAASVQVISVRSARSLLRSAAARDLRTLDEILSAADADPFNSKLFVHGLGWETTSEGLRAAFARYGEIEDCRVGFVQFRHRSSASRALREPQRLIDNCMTACQLVFTELTPH